MGVLSRAVASKGRPVRGSGVVVWAQEKVAEGMGVVF